MADGPNVKTGFQSLQSAPDQRVAVAVAATVGTQWVSTMEIAMTSKG